MAQLIGYICTDCFSPSSLLKMCRLPSVEHCSCLSHTPSHSRICELRQPEGAWQISKSSLGGGNLYSLAGRGGGKSELHGSAE